MATSSIYDTVKIRNAKVVDAFMDAIEESEQAKKTLPSVSVDSRMATKEDAEMLREMRMKQRRHPICIR